MDYKEFSKAISSDTKVLILNTLYDRETSVYDMKKLIDINYKNILWTFTMLENLGLIEKTETTEPPHYAVKYRITEKGKNILCLLPLIDKV